MSALNALRWNGSPGHYEVYYLTLTEPQTGVGVWIRYTMLAPLQGPASASLWFLAMDPRSKTVARKATFGIERLQARAEPFGLQIADSTLSDQGMTGAFEDVRWDLRWAPAGGGYEHVHPLLQRLKIAKTVLVLPHADLSIDGSIEFAGTRLELSGARGAQAHIWGKEHAFAWAWAHCNDFRTADGRRSEGSFVDGASVVVRRSGRKIGPSTPMVGRIDGRDFRSTSPVRILRNRSTYSPTEWRFEAADRAIKLVGEVQAPVGTLAGVTYHDPDGQLAYCYNSEVASMRLHVYERQGRGAWMHRDTLVARGCAHFEYAQRSPVPGLELHLT